MAKPDPIKRSSCPVGCRLILSDRLNMLIPRDIIFKRKRNQPPKAVII